MRDTRLAKRYASALFQTAVSHQMVAAVEADLNAISDLIQNQPTFREFLLSPTTNREDKITFVNRLFGDRATALALNALRLVIEKRRERSLVEIRDVFVEMRRAQEGIIFATVTSAEALAEGHKNAIVHKLADQLGKRIEPEFFVDPSLIGGVKVAYQDNVLDGTVKGTLGKLREKLRYDLLKQS
ncbi:MAG: ATP synthase F1 subunit delta [Fimbriimonas sp.]